MARKVRTFPTPRNEKNALIQIESNRAEKTLYQTALYIRLSKEDGGKTNTTTVENQKALLLAYVKEHPELSVYDIYIDNGYSGINFDRPMFHKMLEEIIAGKVNCVLVKDLSRFGRSYLETGTYLETVFPLFNVRFIAVNESFDTLYAQGTERGMLIPLKNMINEIYARDISQKVITALEVKKQAGHYGGGLAPYGYRKSKTEKGKLEVDEEAAKIVHYLFQLRSEGYSYCSIVRVLNEKKIKSPSAYRFEKGIVKDKKKKDVIWKRHMIENMLKDEVYLGNMVRGKTRSAFYKGEPRHDVPRTEWIVVQGTHQPIISQELFRRVQEVNVQRETL